jgi:hypothetical protein
VLLALIGIRNKRRDLPSGSCESSLDWEGARMVWTRHALYSWLAVGTALGAWSCGPEFDFSDQDNESGSGAGTSGPGASSSDDDEFTSSDDSGSSGDDGDALVCPAPRLSLSTVYYAFGGEGFPDDVPTIHLLFSAGLDREPPYECFTTGSQLYFGSGIHLSMPGGASVSSMPDDFRAQPANLEVEPIRSDPAGEEPFAFGDIFQGTELDPDPSQALAQYPVLAGFVRLCNMHGECDELDFRLEPGP